jgi:hypothetical protein
MKPATSALLDQAGAAASHAFSIFTTVADHEGYPVTYDYPGPVTSSIVRRLEYRLLAGQVTLCPHLSWTAPGPAYWAPWAPGRFRCPHCGQAAVRRVKGTAEDRRCDHCHKVNPSIYSGGVQLAAIVIDLPDGPLCVPPVTIFYGLCHACHDLNAERKSA